MSIAITYIRANDFLARTPPPPPAITGGMTVAACAGAHAIAAALTVQTINSACVPFPVEPV